MVTIKPRVERPGAFPLEQEKRRRLNKTGLGANTASSVRAAAAAIHVQQQIEQQRNTIAVEAEWARKQRPERHRRDLLGEANLTTEGRPTTAP